MMRHMLHAIWGMLHHQRDFDPQLFHASTVTLTYRLFFKRVSNAPKPSDTPERRCTCMVVGEKVVVEASAVTRKRVRRSAEILKWKQCTSAK